MSISSTTSKVIAQGNGSTTLFNFNFPGVANADIQVIYTDPSGNVNNLAPAAYTLTLNPASGGIWGLGGTVFYQPGGSPIPLGSTLTIIRVLPLIQSTVLSNQGAQYPTATEGAIDYVLMGVQQVAEQLARALLIPSSDTLTLNSLPSTTQRASLYLAFDANGQPVCVPGTATGGLPTTAPTLTLTSSSLPGTGNGLYAPTGGNQTGIAANGALAFNVTNPASAVNYWQFQGAATAGAGVAYVLGSSLGSDAYVGQRWNTKGTTTANGGQYNGLVGGARGLETSGRHRFAINGVSALEVTDTYWNPNITYPGATNGWVTISSGWGDSTSTSDMIAGAISVESTIYPGGNPTGASLIIGSKGPSGEIHFLSNGALAHVTVDFPLNSNPIAPDVYATYVNDIRFAGAFGTTGVGPQIKINPSGHANDAQIPLQFYNFANGGYNFASGNGTTTNLQIQHVNNGVNSHVLTPATSSNSPTHWAIGGGGNVRLTLAGSDTAGVDICNGGQYNGTAACAFICRFFGPFEPPDYLTITTQATNGAGPIISVAAASDTIANLNLSSLGTGNVSIFTGNAATHIVDFQSTGIMNFFQSGSFAANGSVATVLGSLGPVGSHTTVQEWMQVAHNGTTRWIPLF